MASLETPESVNFYNSRPGIQSDAGVLIFNEAGDVLLVKPTYRDTWAWTGGGRDLDESPITTARRECIEELGVCPEPLRPAFVDFTVPAQGRHPMLQFLFTPDTPVEATFIDRVKLPPTEIAAVEFVPIAEVAKYMKEYRLRSLLTYVENKPTSGLLYLENGLLV